MVVFTSLKKNYIIKTTFLVLKYTFDKSNIKLSVKKVKDKINESKYKSKQTF